MHSDGQPRSVHTPNFPELLAQLGSSLLISTYQTGHLVVIRPDGRSCNTHFCRSHKPMGVAVGPPGLAVGCATTVRLRRNVVAAASTCEPLGRHDACFVPRSMHVTGSIDVHEMAWAHDEQLWLVNTRFSCLATLDYQHSFRPRWRPSFISAFAPEDRCHLNGLGMVSGRPRFVTALAETDTPAGWREGKARSGVLIDIEADEVLLRGLSMPHSPRWHNGQLWLLESGEGDLVRVDLEKRTWQTVARLPGFTRGLDFFGPLAFVGLSKVRESAVFSGIPLVDRLEERTCGVWVVDTRSGEAVAFLRFEEGVEEIFSVQLLSGTVFPEILEFDDMRASNAFVLPDDALELVPPELRSEVKPKPPGEVLDGSFMAAYRQGLAAREHGRWTKAQSAFDQCLSIHPEQPDALNDLGGVFYQIDQLERASACFERAIKGRVDFAMAHLNLGLALLKLGEYERGWREFEWRWMTSKATPLVCEQPRWDGSDLANKKLLVHSEQGAGDVFHFARFLPRAAARCGHLTVVAPAELHPLLAEIEGIDCLRAAGRLAPETFDYFCPLLSLPLLFAVEGPEPAESQPYLRVPPSVTIDLSSRSKGDLKVGLAWAGSPTHGDDRFRSLDLHELSPLLDVKGVTFFSLQLGERSGQINSLADPREVVDLGDDLRGWHKTAAVISGLDLVISVDTAVCHLAGALGRPIWVLLAAGCDWRWGLSGRTTPWYPTMQLFRQQRHEEWLIVVSEMAASLEQLVRGG